MELGKDGVWRDWTGLDCPACKGSGEDEEARRCGKCGGTGEEYGPVTAPSSEPATQAHP